MNIKKVLSDPSFWILALVNVWLISSYEEQPQIFTTVIWLYWSQSILYGFFNFLDMLTSPKVDVSGFKLPERRDISDASAARTAAFFFLFHFGFFHLVYFIFLFTLPKSGTFQWEFYEKFLLFFFIGQVINFIQHKIQNKDKTVEISSMFFKPYARVVPMHLCILLPAFFQWSHLTVFLIIKTLVDLTMYVFASGLSSKKTIEAEDITAT